jgi:glycerol-3-phosphate acyltransferase PlsY
MLKLILIAALSYLLGSIPFGYLLVRVFRGEDVRQSGSGNIGATNVSRSSPALGALTLVLDALKGTAAVVLAYRLSDVRVAHAKPFQTLAVAAFFGVLGHVFPVWLKFRGGKGVATGLGSFIVIAPNAVMVAVGIFVLVVAVFRYVSLGSILAVASFPLLFAYRMPAHGNASVALAIMATTCLLIVVRHQENIRRLLAGTENRIGGKRS